MSLFHERIKLLKEQSGKTQAQIAEEVEVTPQSLSYYFNGREPNFDVLIKLARCFDVSVDYLLGISETKKHENISIIARTGLSEEAIGVLNTLKNIGLNNIINIINLLIEHEKIGGDGIHFFISLANFIEIEENEIPKYLTKKGELLSATDYYEDEDGKKIAMLPEDGIVSFDHILGCRLIENALLMEIQQSLSQLKEKIMTEKMEGRANY